MSDWETMAAAQDVITAAEAGDYDTQLGITREQRTALDKGRAGDPITLAEFRTLIDLGEHELATNAHAEGRLTLTNGDTA